MLASIAAIAGPAMAILEKAIPDKDLREKLSHELAVLADKQMTAQIEVNKVEAAHPRCVIAHYSANGYARPRCYALI